MGGIDGPYDAIKRLHEIARSGGDGVKMFGNGLWLVAIGAPGGAVDCDLRKVRAESVVDIARDARALAFDRESLLDLAQTALHPPLD